MKRGSTTSCGCRRDQYEKVRGKNNVSFKGYEDIRSLFFKKLRSSAKRRKIVLSITIKDLWDLYTKQNKMCALTGLPIMFGRCDMKQETTASVDRIDSKLGYTIDNIQLVHKDINIMKNSFSVDYFVNLCRMVVENKAYKNIPSWTDEELLKNRFWHFRERK